MSIAQDIIDGARDSLADPSKERWSDARLLRLLDEGQKYIARMYSLLHGESSVFLSTGQTIYGLASDLLIINRCTYLGKVLPLYTYDEMDNSDPGWAARTGSSIEALIYNNRNLQDIRVYPTPDDNFPVTHITMDSPYGVATSVEGATGPAFGVLTDIAFTDEGQAQLKSVFGVVSDGNYLEQLSVLYSRDPKTLVALTDQLDLPPMFDRALKLYVVGHAFSDDLDSKNQEKAAGALAMFENELAILGTRARQSNGKSSVGRTTSYRGFA